MTFEEITDALADNPAASAVWSAGGANTMQVITLQDGTVTGAQWQDDRIVLDFTLPTRPDEQFSCILHGELMGDQWIFSGREFVNAADEKLYF